MNKAILSQQLIVIKRFLPFDPPKDVSTIQIMAWSTPKNYIAYKFRYTLNDGTVTESRDCPNAKEGKVCRCVNCVHGYFKTIKGFHDSLLCHLQLSNVRWLELDKVNRFLVKTERWRKYDKND